MKTQWKNDTMGKVFDAFMNIWMQALKIKNSVSCGNPATAVFHHSKFIKLLI